MSLFTHAVHVASSGPSGQDRAVVIARDDGLVIALADGAGGTGDGAAAADAVTDAVVRSPDTPPASLLCALDERSTGQTTAVILALRADLVRGASVGDSGAWLLDGEMIVELTHAQHRKPLVGAGCIPVAFEAALGPTQTLLVASDGLLKYADPRDIARVVARRDLDIAAGALIELVRLPSGALQDDVAIVLCRRR